MCRSLFFTVDASPRRTSHHANGFKRHSPNTTVALLDAAVEEMLVTLLLVCGAAAFSSIKDLPKEVGGYTISRLGRTGRASKKATPLVITDNVVTLERATSGTSLSSRYVEAIRNADNPDLELEKRATVCCSLLLSFMLRSCEFVGLCWSRADDFGV